MGAMRLRHALIFCFLGLTAGTSIGNGDGVCDDINVDIMFILDATTKTTNDFFYEMNRFMGHFIDHFRESMDQNTTRFAAISFSSEAEICFNFTKPYSNSTKSRPSPDFTFSSCKGEFPVTKSLSKSSKIIESQRNTAEAIHKARNQIQRNAQPGVAKFAILATDGLPQDCNKTLNEAQILKLVNGVVMIVITTKQMSSATELIRLASSPLHLIYIDETYFKSTLNHQLLDLLCKRTFQRNKRSALCADESYTASPGRTCYYITWTADGYHFVGGTSNNCYPAGSTPVQILRNGSNRVKCTFHVHVTVYYCSPLPSTDPNGRRSCSGDADNVYGSRCYFNCNSGYTRNGASEVTCNLISGSAQWSDNFPSCQVQHCEALPFFPYGSRQCTRSDENVFQSVCTHTCNTGFTLHGSSRIECLAQSSTVHWSSAFPVCHASDQPNLSTCRISVTDSQGQDTLSGYLGNDTSCKNQRDEWIRTQPRVLHFAIKADHNPNIPKPEGVSEVKAGVVEAIIKVIVLSVSGRETVVLQKILNSKDTCNESASSTSPLFAGKILDCEGNLNLTSLNLNDGERLCADITAYSGGYYNLVDGNNNFQKQVIFEKIPTTKRVCFKYDNSSPVHCFAKGCNAQPLELYSRTTRSPLLQVKVSGWEDPVPRNGPPSSASHILKYRLEIHQVDVGLNYLSVQNDEISESTKEWNETSAGLYYVNISLPEGDPRLYGILLEVHDFAGNVRFARRLVLLDNSSFVDLHSNYSLRVTTADIRSSYRWQTNISQHICVDWKNRFYNTEMIFNNLLMPVTTDTGRDIYDSYDQINGLLPIRGTDNVNGIIKFELSWSRDGINLTGLREVLPLQAQTTCPSGELKDGETYVIWIKATDIMNNTQEDNVTVSIDHTSPLINIRGLRGRFGREGLFAHNTTDLHKMVLVVEVMDPHSGILTLQWEMGTIDRSSDVGQQAVGVNRLENVTDCSRNHQCYCPSVGVCELYLYNFTFNNLVNTNTHNGLHHRDYYITITATNHARLPFTESLQILVDASPPSAGVVLEGLGDEDEAEMDFTSSNVLHVRWHGFLDHESGILMYRIVLAARCLTAEEFDGADNATEYETQDVIPIIIPSEGSYVTSIVAYNGAMEPSAVVCSDGVKYDTTPPTLLNVSIIHARTERMLGCLYPNQVWLIHRNFTRVRLSPSLQCLNICSAESLVSIEYIPVSSNYPLDPDVSDDLCSKLPLITLDSPILLPSDYLHIAWEARDEESDMEEYYIGIGEDITAETAPNLLPFVRTHGHKSYSARHSGLGHGATFFIFLQALSKAGLYANLTLGPITIDVTPPDVSSSLTAFVDGAFLVVTWTNGTFTDSEQPSGADFEITFRVGHEEAFVTPHLSLSASSLTQCTKYHVTGCALYPIIALHAQDTEIGRSFFFQLHVTNAAGHVTSVNSSSVRLPAHLSPSHSVVIDVLRSSLVLTDISELMTTKTYTSLTNESSATENTRRTTDSTLVTTQELWPARGLSQSHLIDVDVIAEPDEICIAWGDFYRAESVTVQIAVGTAHDIDDIISFTPVQVSPTCINATNLPVYTKLFSLVKANNPGGTTILSSDGFYIVPRNDPQNKMMVFNGKGCTPNDNTGYHVITNNQKTVDVNVVSEVALHEGDILFVQFNPFVEHVTFQNAILLQTTLSGYQIVISKSPNVTVILPTLTSTNITMETQNCLKDAVLGPVPQARVSVTWEMFGPWTGLCKTVNVELVDETCKLNSPKKDKYSKERCLVAKERVVSTRRRVNFPGVSIISGHTFTASVSACFDDECITSATPSSVIYDSTQRDVVVERAVVLMQTSQEIEVEIEAKILPFINISQTATHQLSVFRWAVTRDAYATKPIADWKVVEGEMAANLKVQGVLHFNGSGKGTLYACVQPVFPWRADNPKCHRFIRPGSTSQVDPFHVIELSHEVFRDTNFDGYLHSDQLGSKLHELYDLDLDFARSDVMISAILTNNAGLNVTWFLTTLPQAPQSGDCAQDSSCITMKVTQDGKVVFSRTVSKLQDGNVYYVCVLASARSRDLQTSEYREHTDVIVEECGDGVVIDDTPPIKGDVAISNSDSGYLAEIECVVVTWSGFSDVEMEVDQLPDDITLNYSVSLGSYPGAEDIAHFVSVGQRTTWTFEHLNLTSGTNCIATVKAQDRVGLVTQASSVKVIIDNTPPNKGYVAAGKITRETFVAGPDVPVHWEGVEDQESGVKLLEVGLSSLGTSDDAIPFQRCTGTSCVLPGSSELMDGHSYVVLLKVTNGAGLTSLTSSESFIVDNSPPGIGVVWNSAPNTSDHAAYSTEIGVYRAYWAGFSDPHSGLAHFRVGVGSHPGETDVRPFHFIGLQTSYIWIHEFEQGKKYYVTLEACNRAGLCRVTSSSSLTFDNSPPNIGLVTVGFDGRHSKFVGHNSSLPVQWAGFSDAQTGIEEFFWCVGLTPGNCNVTSFTPTMLSRATLRSGLTLPVATPLYVTVRARNPVGLETVSVSDSFVVDITSPEIIVKPHFLSPRDGSSIEWQWDRATLCLAWKFYDPDSSVVAHTINIRSQLTGRLVTESIRISADNELTLLLEEDNFLLDGDQYWAAVTACNAASLCTTATSAMLLIDSTPPVMGTIHSPLQWKQENVTRDGINETLGTVVNMTWWKFSDLESGIVAYYVTAGRKYNGEELTGGRIQVLHDNSTQNQTFSLSIPEILTSGDDIYFHVWAVNKLGLYSPIARMAFDVLQENANGKFGTMVLIRHSCDVGYCTNECTCAPTGQVCKANFTQCQELDSSQTHDRGIQVYPYIGLSSGPLPYTTSAKCLEGHWELSNQTVLSNISRFEWSFGLANMSAGEGVFDTLTEANWYDVGRTMHAVHCLPEKRTLMSGQHYVLHVKVWLSSEHHVTFLSQPILVDHSPPQIRRGKSVLECRVTCSYDIDYTTESSVIACWNGVFSDVQSNLTHYVVWVGTAQYADDYIKRTNVGLNTSFVIPTNNFQEGTRYYVTVRAWNGVGLQTTAVSDGVVVDVSPPITGVVFANDRINNRHAQSSDTSLLASWHGFEDKYSGISSYHLILYDVENVTIPVATFPDVGVKTEILLEGLALEHKHSYKVSMYAGDIVGWKSEVIESLPVLVDTTPPEGVTCTDFRHHETTFLTYKPIYSLLHDTYSTTFNLESVLMNEVIKVTLTATDLELGATGYIGIDELQMPLYFVYGKLGNATAEHVLLLPTDGNKTLEVVVEANSGVKLSAQLYRCSHTEISTDKAVTLHQLSQYIISVCARILDGESRIKSLLVGVGTTKGGLQVQPLTPVSHSSHVVFETHVQHGAPLYATVIAENYAGLWARFISQPIEMDRTAPVLSEVVLILTYEGEGQVNGTHVWAEAQWTAEDKESGVATCTCQLEGQLTTSNSVQVTSDVRPGLCRWLLKRPEHGARVVVVVSCVNGIQIHSTKTSQPALILLGPPDLSEATVLFLANNAFMSPFEWSDPEIRSANSSLEFYWRGLNDPTITAVQYRLMLDSRPLVDWSAINTYKTSAMLERIPSPMTSGKVSAEVKVFNSRLMTSEVVSTAIRFDDTKPYLSGRAASLTLRDGHFHLDWQGVFNVNRDVTYSVFAGTAQGYGDVINHVVTKTTSLQTQSIKPVSDVHVTIQAVYANGLFEIYQTMFKL